jgi:hypothetical protein
MTDPPRPRDPAAEEELATLREQELEGQTPRPRNPALEAELTALHEQELEGHPPRPRDPAVEAELTALREQELEGHKTPKEQRRAEELEHRLYVDEKGVESRQRFEQDRERNQKDERARHRR